MALLNLSMLPILRVDSGMKHCLGYENRMQAVSCVYMCSLNSSSKVSPPLQHLH